MKIIQATKDRERWNEINSFNKKIIIFVGIKSWEVVTCEGSHLFHNGTDTSLLMTH